ncbi:MAG: hypothetical protein WCB18_09800 [Thermoplasmata archaeon]
MSSDRPGGAKHTPPPRQPSLRSKLKESWPLLVAGGGCVALAVLLELQRTTRSIDHLSPTLLFLAVGLTGIGGGVASYVVGPEENGDAVVARPLGSGPKERDSRKKWPPRVGVAERWNGRPVPDVISTSRFAAAAPAAGSSANWTDEPEDAEIPPSVLLDAGTYRRPPRGRKGRILRLSEEGALTVYSLEDALRDLELVDQVVHSRRKGGATTDLPARRPSSDRSNDPT